MAVISAPTSVCACVKKQETKAKIQSKDITQTKVHMNFKIDSLPFILS